MTYRALLCCCAGGDPPGDGVKFEWTILAHWTKHAEGASYDPETEECTATWQCDEPAIPAGDSVRLVDEGSGPQVFEYGGVPGKMLTGCCIDLSGASPALSGIYDGEPGYQWNPGTSEWEAFTPPSVGLAGGVIDVGTVFSAAPWNSEYRDYTVILAVGVPGVGSGISGIWSLSWAAAAEDRPHNASVVLLYYGRPIGTPAPDELRLARMTIGTIQRCDCGDPGSCAAGRNIDPPFEEDPDYIAVGSPPLVLPFNTCAP